MTYRSLAILLVAAITAFSSVSQTANAQIVQTGGTQIPTNTFVDFNEPHLETIWGIPWDAAGGDGYGTIATGLDLGLLDPAFTGITFDISITDLTGIGVGIFTTSGGQIHNVAVTMDFSSPLDVQRQVGGQVWRLGEEESLTGVDYFTYEPTSFPGLTFSGGAVGGDNWVNNTQGVIIGSGSNPLGGVAEAYGVTSVTSTHNGGFTNNWSLGFGVSAAPEPSSALLSCLAGGIFLMRRRRLS